MTREHASGPDDESTDTASRLADLHAHLAATAELPIDPKTNRWLGEAEAVARDATSPELDSETRRKRVRQVERLLSAADEPVHEGAAARVEKAREACAEMLSESY